MKTQKLERALSRYFAAMYSKSSGADRKRMKGGFQQKLIFRQGSLILITFKGAIFYEIVGGQLVQPNRNGRA